MNDQLIEAWWENAPASGPGLSQLRALIGEGTSGEQRAAAMARSITTCPVAFRTQLIAAFGRTQDPAGVDILLTQTQPHLWHDQHSEVHIETLTHMSRQLASLTTSVRQQFAERMSNWTEMPGKLGIRNYRVLDELVKEQPTPELFFAFADALANDVPTNLNSPRIQRSTYLDRCAKLLALMTHKEQLTAYDILARNSDGRLFRVFGTKEAGVRLDQFDKFAASIAIRVARKDSGLELA